jgi:hypothetical protein
MTLNEYKAYLLREIAAVRQRDPSPDAFIAGAAVLDTMAQAAISRRRSGGAIKPDGVRFAEFVRKFMRPEYASFRYAGGQQDLPEQMYAILRSGLIHGRSLAPNPPANGKRPIGRVDSIILDRAGTHLYPWQDADRDAAVFVFSTFVTDIEAAIRRVFVRAANESGLQVLVERYLHDHPPVQALPSWSIPVGTTFTHSPSGSFVPPPPRGR